MKLQKLWKILKGMIYKMEKYKTPYYVINKDELEESVVELQKAVEAYWANTIIGYSFKTNSLPWISEFFKGKGFYAEVVSDDEYNLAKLLGYENHRIIYNGLIKSHATFLEALENGCVVNIDSEQEIMWLGEAQPDKKYSIGIRINFDLEKACPNESQCGDEGGRFGFCYENGEFERVLKLVKKYDNVEVKGVHFHCSSKTRSLSVYKAISHMACQIKKEFNLDLNYLDIGGGFFGGLNDKPRFKDYLECISGILKEEYDSNRTTLILEPGMSLIGPPISFVTSVIDIKETNRNRFVITDGSRNNVDPLMGKNSYFYTIEYLSDESRRKNIDRQIVVGYTCMENDRLFKIENSKQLVVGDKVIYYKVGAYTMCLSPLFIKYFPDVYVQESDKLKLVRNRWTVNEYTQNCFWGANYEK